jgi:hypothetical protein
MAITKINWRIIELYVEISSIDNAGDSLNNLSEIKNKTENTIPSIIYILVTTGVKFYNKLFS